MNMIVKKKIITISVVGIVVLSFTYILTTYSTSHDAHLDDDIDYIGDTAEDMYSYYRNEEFHRGDDEVAKQMAKKVRVLCWVMTNPANHQKKARHVKATWGKRCNILLFMSSTNDSALPTIQLPVKEGRDYLWAKTKEAFKYVYEHHLNDADWFMKADDDTYVIVENLRYMLSPYQPSEPLHFGCRINGSGRGYMSGGAGYVLSHEAVRLFVEKGVNDSNMCRQDHEGSEDVEMGKCMEKLGVKLGDSRDSLARGRFFPDVPEHHLTPGKSKREIWFSKFKYYPSEKGMACCSDYVISFHYVPPNQMYVMEYLIYHVRLYGIRHKVDEENTKGLSSTTDSAVMSTTLQHDSSEINSNSSRLKPAVP